MGTPKGIPTFIRELRRYTRLTQEKFAAKVGVSFPTVNRWENGKATPSPLALTRLKEIAKNLGTEEAELLARHFDEGT